MRWCRRARAGTTRERDDQEGNERIRLS